MDLTAKHCVPCEGGTPPFSEEEENKYLANVDKWLLIKDGTHKLRRQFIFSDFLAAMVFVNKVATVAQSEGHHPDILIVYNKVQIDVFTHAVGGLSENDFILAAKIDALS